MTAAFAPSPAAHRLSPTGLAGVVVAHLVLASGLVAWEIVPLPAALTPLSVELLPAPPPPEVSRPQPRPVEKRPLPAPHRQPAPTPPVLARESSEPAAPSVAVAEKAPPSPPVPAAPATVVEPRFDAAYLNNPPPAYPPLSRRLGEEGRSILRVLVGPDGAAQQVQIHRSSGSSRLDNAAAEAVGRWKFVPARRGDEALAAWVLVPIAFSLKD